MLRKVFLASFAILVSGCGDGPRISYCTIDARASAELHLAQCSDPEEKSFTSAFYNLNNWVFASPSDQERLLKVCKHNRKNPDDKMGAAVTFCVADCEFPAQRCALQCSDGVKGWTQTVEASDGYAGTSPRDTERLLRYCKFIPEGKGLESLDHHSLLHRP